MYNVLYCIPTLYYPGPCQVEAGRQVHVQYYTYIYIPTLYDPGPCQVEAGRQVHVTAYVQYIYIPTLYDPGPCQVEAGRQADDDKRHSWHSSLCNWLGFYIV